MQISAKVYAIPMSHPQRTLERFYTPDIIPIARALHVPRTWLFCYQNSTDSVHHDTLTIRAVVLYTVVRVAVYVGVSGTFGLSMGLFTHHEM